MGLSVIRNDPHDIIALRKVKTLLRINQMGLSAPRAYSPEIISLQTVISLFFLLTWPLCIAIIINIGRWGYLTKAEASVALDTDPFGFHATLHTIHHTSVRSSLVLLSYHSPYLILLYPNLPLPQILLSPSPPPSPAACASLISGISMVGCSHHCLDRGIHGFCSAAIHKNP